MTQNVMKRPSNPALLLLTVMLIVFTLGTFLFSCESKTERKADKVTNAKEEVMEAQMEGETKEEVMQKQAKLESARKVLKKTWDADRDKLRKELNAEIEDIDEKTARYERNLKAASGEAKMKLTNAVSTLKKERTTLTSLLKELDQVTATSWTKNRKAIETVKDGVDHRVDALDDH